MDINKIVSELEKYTVPDFVPHREDIEAQLYDIRETLQSIAQTITEAERQAEAIETHGGFSDIKDFDKWQNGILCDMNKKFPFLGDACDVDNEL